MRVGIVTTWFERGAAYVSRQYRETLESEGAEVFIYARGGEKFAINDNIWDDDRVYWQKNNDVPYMLYVNKNEFETWIKNNKLDVIIFNEQSWFEPIIVCKKMGLKVGSYIDYYTESMIDCFDIFDFVICNTKKHLKAFEKHSNPIFLKWGTKTSLFEANNRNREEDIVRFFHSCGMNPHRKGTDLLISAYCGLCAQDLKDSRLIIHSQVGLKDISKLLDLDVRSIFNSLINSGRIKIITETVSAPGLYHLGDVYVYPSRLDGLGLTVAEAKSCGMNIIVPDDAPMNEFCDLDNDLVVKIDKLFCREDAYYWPQNEVCLNDFKEKLAYVVRNKDSYICNHMMNRENAIKNWEWSDNSRGLVELISRIDTIALNEDVVRKCVKYNESRLPFCYRFKFLYMFLYPIYKFFKRRFSSVK